MTQRSPKINFWAPLCFEIRQKQSKMATRSFALAAPPPRKKQFQQGKAKLSTQPSASVTQAERSEVPGSRIGEFESR